MLQKQRTISLYWKCQLIYWGLAALQWAYIGYVGTGFSWKIALVHFTGDLIIYIVPSHLYRNFSVKMGWHHLGLRELILRLVPSLLLLGFVFMVLTIVKNYAVRFIFQSGFNETLQQAFDTHALLTFITGIRLMAIWLLAYYAWHYSQRELNAIKETNRLQLMAKDAAFNNLTAQLNPHFFFNSLNSIKALVIENPRSARRAIDILSELLRNSLYANDQTLVSIKDELALVNDYLELEKIRFEEKLAVKVEAEEVLLTQKILRLSIQTLVENAIKHGIGKTTRDGFIKILVKRKDDHILVTVESSGSLNPPFKKGIGLSTLEERLQLQFGAESSFSILQHSPASVLAIIKTPMQ